MTLAACALLLVGVPSCTKDGTEIDNETKTENSGGENGGGETKMSSYSSSESHNMGKNCMGCHVSGGQGEGWFTVGGTVYKNNSNSTYPGATLKLYSGPNGSGNLVATIPVDKLGNFYTTQSINFGSGLYPVVIGNNGQREMDSPISSGQCNKCHGNSTGKISLN